MSRYLVDRFAYEADADADLLAAYLDDPAGCIDTWERARAEAGTRGTHTFTREERAALVTRDIRTLYAMGVHPFLLFCWLRPILLEELGDLPSVVAYYGDAIDGLGRPDFGT
jgi:hypothetical protein